MDYLLTFEDGSEAIAHSGVKGMKWGVWNEETRARRTGAKRHQKKLRDLNSSLMNQTINAKNASDSSAYYTRASQKATIKGKDEKADKYMKTAQKHSKKLDEVSSQAKNTAKSLVDELAKTESEGYSIKVIPVDFTIGSGYGKYTRGMNKKYGIKLTEHGGSYANTSSGNYFQVRPNETLSDEKKKLRSLSKQTMQSYRPQIRM